MEDVMNAAPGKPAPIIPGAPGKKRQVCPTITTSWLTTAGMVKATYQHETEYPHPSAAPVFALMRYEIPAAGELASRWFGTITLEAFSATEIGALDSLFQTLMELPEIPEDTWAAAVPVWRALETAARDGAPWAELPLGARPLKPRRARTKWNDPTRPGKQIPIYPDLMRPHVDPNCTCVHCKNHITPTRTKKK
jgi:hypothetical protein